MKKLILTLALTAFTIGLMAADGPAAKSACPFAGKTACSMMGKAAKDKSAACPMKQAGCCQNKQAAKSADNGKALMSPKAATLAGK